VSDANSDPTSCIRDELDAALMCALLFKRASHAFGRKKSDPLTRTNVTVGNPMPSSVSDPLDDEAFQQKIIQLRAWWGKRNTKYGGIEYLAVGVSLAIDGVENGDYDTAFIEITRIGLAIAHICEGYDAVDRRDLRSAIHSLSQANFNIGMVCESLMISNSSRRSMAIAKRGIVSKQAKERNRVLAEAKNLIREHGAKKSVRSIATALSKFHWQGEPHNGSRKPRGGTFELKPETIYKLLREARK
jgi:hypothetical protein